MAETAAEWRVALVGDSVLDDFYWLDRPTEDVRAQTERTLRQTTNPSGKVEVMNFAVDESTVSCVLRGRVPGAHYRDGRKKAGMEPYPVDGDGVVRPIALLRRAKPTHVVSKLSAVPSAPCLCRNNRFANSRCCASNMRTLQQ